MAVFTMDGKSYAVKVKALTRKFSILDTDESGRTQNGGMYRDIIGTYYNYEMTVIADEGNPSGFDQFWDDVSKPVSCRVCRFPYNQSVMEQEMYVTSGSQELKMMGPARNRWGDLKLSYIAMKPRLVP